jgi:hypothetical protein
VVCEFDRLYAEMGEMAAQSDRTIEEKVAVLADAMKAMIVSGMPTPVPEEVLEQAPVQQPDVGAIVQKFGGQVTQRLNVMDDAHREAVESLRGQMDSQKEDLETVQRELKPARQVAPPEPGPHAASPVPEAASPAPQAARGRARGPRTAERSRGRPSAVKPASPQTPPAPPEPAPARREERPPKPTTPVRQPAAPPEVAAPAEPRAVEQRPEVREQPFGVPVVVGPSAVPVTLQRLLVSLPFAASPAVVAEIPALSASDSTPVQPSPKIVREYIFRSGSPRVLRLSEANVQTAESWMKPLPVTRVSTDARAHLPNAFVIHEVVDREPLKRRRASRDPARGRARARARAAAPKGGAPPEAEADADAEGGAARKAGHRAAA